MLGVGLDRRPLPLLAVPVRADVGGQRRAHVPDRLYLLAFSLARLQGPRDLFFFRQAI
jgi:hypothetical protein